MYLRQRVACCMCYFDSNVEVLLSVELELSVALGAYMPQHVSWTHWLSKSVSTLYLRVNVAICVAF